MALPPTRSSPSSTTSAEMSADQSQTPTCLLCLLPDVPLLRILPCLSGADLFAVARACLRVAALTRTLQSIWHGKKFRVEPSGTVADCHKQVRRGHMSDLFRVAPVKKLELTYSVSALAGFCSYRSGTVVLLVNRIDISGVVAELGPMLKHLAIHASAVNVPLASLRDAHSLEILELDARPKHSESWPQSLCLPRLHTVRLDCKFHHPDEATLAVLRSLLLAHSGQLRCVSLCALPLMPLLDACPADLQRLTIWPARGVAARLDRMRGLKELALAGHAGDSAAAEMEHLLRSWSGPLERLELNVDTRDETVRALGAGGLTSLASLVLAWPFADLRSLGASLSGLPRLRLLDLRDNMPPPEVFRNVSPATVPALELLLISGYDSSSVPDWRMKYVFKVPSDVDALVPALKDLVLRAPKQLHVGLRHFNEHVVEEAVECRIFLRHSADESECALCAEVAATLGTYRGWPVPVEKCEVFE